MKNFGLSRKLLDFLLSMLPLIWLSGVSLPAMAATENRLSPFVSTSISRDSNLLRLDDSARAGINASDNIRQTVAGIHADWKIARQNVLLAAVFNDNRYARYSMLDYRGRDLQGSWNWQVGNQVSGRLGYINKVTIADFDYQQSLVSNLYTLERYFWDGLWLFHPSWRVGMGVSRNTISYADINQRRQNRADDVWETTLQYLSTTTSKLGIKHRETTSTHPNLAVNFASMLDNQYHQREILATVDWIYSGHSQLRGQAGMVQRRHDHFSSRNYEGVTARGTYTWLPSATIRAEAAAWREIAAYDDATSSYSVNRGVSLESSWAATPKITFNGKFQRDTRKFLGDPGIVELSAARVDSYTTLRAGVSYQPTRNINLNLSAAREKRFSNQPGADFESKMASINVIFKM
jgi:exopolysaccharide biosynthesis operon protein EpsL